MTIQTFRPSATDKISGGMTVVGSGGANGVTDDAPADDSSYITSDGWGQYVWLAIGDISLTGVQRIKQVKGKIRCFHNSADVGHVDEVDWRFRDGSFANESKATTLGTNSNTALEKETGWYTTYPGKTAFSWTAARFNRVQASIAWRARDTTANGNPQITQLRVSEVYVLADVHTQLNITAVTVTGNTTTSQPTVGWTLAVDPDNDPQTKWSLAVFKDSTVSTPGFNPETTAAVYRITGNGNVVQAVIGTKLTDGVSYQAFVKVAKDWPGPDGPLWYSNWTSSGTFAVTLTAPAPPTLTVTQETTLPGYRNRIVALMLGINDLSADTASFENNNVGTWVAGTNANAPTTSGTNPKSGSFAGVATATAAGNVELLSGTFATSKRVKPGAAISATISTRAVTAARTVQVGIRWFDETGATISTPMSAGNANVTTGYTTHTLANQTAPANAYSYVIRMLILSAAAAGEQHRFDETGGIRGTSATWSQGGYVDSGTITFFRLLRIDPDLNRTPVQNWMHEQIRSAGALKQSTEGFSVRASTDELRYRPLDRTFPGNPDTAGEGMLDWFVRAGATSFLDIGGSNGVTTDFTWPYLMPVIPTMSFTFGSAVWVDSGTRAVKYGIVFVDESNNVISSTFTANINVTTATQQITVAATAPAGAVFARIAVDATPAGATDWHHLMAQLWFRPTTPNMPNLCDALVPWDGTLTGDPGDVDIEIVRGGDSLALATDGDPTLVLYDHEAPPDRPVIYSARFTGSNISGDPVTSGVADGVSVYMPPITRTVIKDPFDPQRAALVNVTTPSSQGRTPVVDETELHGMHRDGDPVFVRTWSGHERTFELTTASFMESMRLDKLLSSSRSLLVQHPDGGQTYLRVKSPNGVRFTRGKDKIAITGAETKRPAV